MIQLTKSYKMAVSFVLSNADFPPLPTVFKLHSTSINVFSDQHISNATNVISLFANCYVTHYVSLILL